MFYNGTEERPAVEELLLSDAFQKPMEKGAFEWTAKVVNLNHAGNHEFLKKCKPLQDYTALVSKIQIYQKTMTLEDAVNKSVTECIADGMLAEFLTAHRAEVLQVYLAEVNEEVLRKNLKEEGFSEGFSEGVAEGGEAMLFRLIEKKIHSGKSIEQIASEVEMTAEEVRPYYDAAREKLKNE